MKFGNTGRDITDKQKFMSNKPRGSFLDRFKGRTLQLGKEGHLGVVKNTKIPIKAVYDEPNQSYNNNQKYDSVLLQKSNIETTRNTKPKSNFEALSPLKRSSSTIEDNFEHRNNRYESFAKNFQKNKNDLTKSYNNPSSLKRGLANAGNNVMRSSFTNTMNNDYPKMGSSHSVNPSQYMNNSGLSFNNDIKSPNTSQDPKQPYSAMKIPAAMGGKNGISVQKSSFYSDQKGNSNYRKKFMMSDLKDKKPNPMPYSNNSMAGNSDGFMNTAVSTPMYNKNSYGQPGGMTNALSILHRSMEKNSHYSTSKNLPIKSLGNIQKVAAPHQKPVMQKQDFKDTFGARNRNTRMSMPTNSKLKRMSNC